jgi:hypothetical protein
MDFVAGMIVDEMFEIIENVFLHVSIALFKT